MPYVENKRTQKEKASLFKHTKGTTWYIVHESENSEIHELICENPYIATCGDSEEEVEMFFFDVLKERIDIDELDIKMALSDRIEMRLRYYYHRLVQRKPYNHHKGISQWETKYSLSA